MNSVFVFCASLLEDKYSLQSNVLLDLNGGDLLAKWLSIICSDDLILGKNAVK